MPARWNAYIAAVASRDPAPDTFTGFGPAVTDWFVALASDDSRAFWRATRDVWQRDIRSPLEAPLGELAAEVGGRVKLFRPYRDMRYASVRDHPRATLLRRKGSFLGSTMPPGASLESSAPRGHARR